MENADARDNECIQNSRFEHLRMLAEEHPSSGQAWYNYAVALHKECSPSAETVTALEQAQDLFLDRDLRLRLGDSLIQTGKVKEGLYQICQYLNDHPTAFAYRVLGMHLLDLGRWHRARKFFRRSLLINNQNSHIYYLFGNLLFYTSKRDAAAYYRKALAIDSEDQPAWGALGHALLERPETRLEGLEALERALALDPKDAWSMLCLAMGHWLAGQLDEADQYFKRVTAENPDKEFYQEKYAAFLRMRAYVPHISPAISRGFYHPLIFS